MRNRCVKTECGFKQVLPGGPADATGHIALGDRVISVNGIYVTDSKSVDQVSSLILGKQLTHEVVITLRLGPKGRAVLSSS